MKKVLFSILALACMLIVFMLLFKLPRGVSSSLSREVTSPSSAATATPETANAESLTPNGWKLLMHTQGDLNDDGIADLALVAESRTLEEFSYPRRLMIFFKNKQNDYRLSVQSDNIILGVEDGGVFGDPFQGISIDSGILLLGFYGGGSWRWSYNYHLKFQDGDWYLIGKDVINFWTHEPEKVFKSEYYDYLARKIKTVTGSGWRDELGAADNLEELPVRDTETWQDIEENRLIKLIEL